MTKHKKELPTFNVISGGVVKEILCQLGNQAIDIVSGAYQAHEAGNTVNPDSYFLKFPEQPQNRIIALPAAITSELTAVSGIKWIASYPDNIKVGLPRASAVLVLNDPQTGYPFAFMESALISAVRTAASAVLGAYELCGRKREVKKLAIVGGGVIARNILKMFCADDWLVKELVVNDLDPESSISLVNYALENGVLAARSTELMEALSADVVVFATNAGEPYVLDPATFKPGQIVLNISLRDLGADIVNQAYNFFDDIDHCIKANTSPHLAEQKYGNRNFVTGTVAQVVRDEIPLSYDKPIIYSPFGMGILDLALGNVVHNRAVKEGRAIQIPHFFGEESRW